MLPWKIWMLGFTKLILAFWEVEWIRFVDYVAVTDSVVAYLPRPAATFSLFDQA